MIKVLKQFSSDQLFNTRSFSWPCTNVYRAILCWASKMVHVQYSKQNFMCQFTCTYM